MDLWLAEQLALAWLLLGDAVAEVDDPDHDHEVVNEDKPDDVDGDGHSHYDAFL